MTYLKIGDKVSTSYTNIANKTDEITAIYRSAATIMSDEGYISHHKLSRLELVK